MDEQLKRRLVGAIVLVSLAVIFVPMLLEDDAFVDNRITETVIPPRPEVVPVQRIKPVEAPVVAPKVAEKPVEPVRPAPSPVPKTETAKAKQPEAAKPTPVKAPKAEKKPAPLSSWVIQVASFSKRENADKLVQRLRKAKYPAFMEQISVDKKRMYRVRVGPEVDQKRAQRMASDIQKKFKLKGRLERHP